MENTLNQPSKFWTKMWVEMNDNWRETCNTNSQIKFKTSTKKSRFSNYSNVHIFAKRTIRIVGDEANAAAIQTDRNNK